MTLRSWHHVAVGISLALALHACATSPRPEMPVHTEPGHDATSQHSFADVDRWRLVFDDPGRDAWQKPVEVVAALAIRPGMTVADLGAGTGYFERYLSRAVGPHGSVLAVDTEPNLVQHLRSRAQSEGLDNVVPILATYADPHLPAGVVDRILIVDTYHHINDRLNYFERLHQSLTANGRVMIVDWHKRELPEGPPLEHKLSRDQVVDEMRTAGYALVGEPDIVPYQYVLVFAASPH